MKKEVNEFLQRAIGHYRNRYDYLEVRERFQHMYSRVPVLCPAHGRFWVVAKAHLKGEGCLKCERKEERQLTMRREATLIARERAFNGILPGIKIDELEHRKLLDE